MARLKCRQWLAGLLPMRRWRIVMQVDEGDLIPDRLPRRGAALAGPPGAPKWLALDCPCGRGHRIMVNLDMHRRPVWRLVRSRPLTVRPSLDVIHAGNRCHFVITSGKIHWSKQTRKLQETSQSNDSKES
jgi:Family of unknown function (DUF6527)